MGSYEATNVVLAKIKNLEPEHASKIMGYLLINLEDSELVRLACSPDPVLHSLILRVKAHLGFTLSSPSSPSPLSPNPIARPFTNPFSKSFSNGFDFSRKPSSPSSHPWPPISPKSSPLLSYDNIRASGSVPVSSFSPSVKGDCNTLTDFVDEHQVNEYFPFLNDSSKNNDFVDPHNWNNGDAHFHRRSFSASDACLGGDKPCLYFARGFCKNGSNCKFVHCGFTDSLDATASMVGSPSKFEGLEQHEEFMRMKAAQQHQRLVAASEFMAGAGASSPSSYDKYIDFLIQQQNDPQRFIRDEASMGTSTSLVLFILLYFFGYIMILCCSLCFLFLHSRAAAAFMMGEECFNFGRGKLERNDFLAMVSAEKPNSALRQIYLTFPAESTFKDEDVSEYFSKFGPVQDVRIPYQQKRMFGFVTFVYPETVRLILSKGNPHFICDSRVLVKPYKEKGKILDKRPQHQQQQLERGDFSPCFSPSAFDSKEPYDYHLGARMLYTPHDILLRRKFEEQAELQQVIELQERRLKNLQLPDFKNNPIHHHQRSLSVGSPFPLPNQLHSHINSAALSSDSTKGDVTGYSDSLTSTISLGTAAEQQLQKEADSACIGDIVGEKGKDSINAEVIDLDNSVEQALPDSLFASPTKAAADNLSDFPALTEVKESAVISTSSSSHNKLEPPSTFNDMASY